MLLLLISGSIYGADRDLFREAESRYSSGNYAAALDLYSRYISENRISPNIPDAQFKKAVCYYQLGDKEEAGKLFEKIKRNYSTTGHIESVPFWLGRIALDYEQWERAADYFNEYISGGADTLTVEAYLYRAMSYQKMSRPDDAAYSLELLLAKDEFTDDGYITALLCSFYLNQGKYDDLIKLTDNIENKSYNDEFRKRILLNRAEAFYRNDRLAEAESLYRELTSADDPDLSAAWQRLFTIYSRLGRQDELDGLLKNAENSLRGNPEVLQDFRMRIGVASYNAGDIETARVYFLTIWDTSAPSEIDGLVPLYYSKILEPENTRRAADILEIFLKESDDRRPAVLVRLAEIYTNYGDYRKAENRLEQFFTDYPDSEFFYEAAYLKAFLCYEQDRYDEALAYIEQSYSADSEGSRTAALLRLESTLLKKTARYQESLDKLERYIGFKSDDIRAALDVFRLRFILKQYNKILVESVDFKWDPMVREQDMNAYLLSSYITGLSAIAVNDYSRAVAELSLISPVNAEESGLIEIYPYALFYKGWALYRMNDYPAASVVFNELITEYPEAQSAPEAAYLGGWCNYIQGKYEAASRFFVQYSNINGKDERGRFMYAKNLAAQERFSEAANIFAEIARDREDSPLADDALFEKASLYALMGNTSQAAADYAYLYKKYGGRLAEEGMFRRGELFYNDGRYAEAVEAFYNFRRAYPQSKLFDAALYWGGLSLEANGESFGAVLLWENIIDNYRTSVFRASAMLHTAATYKDSGDYASALEMYERCRIEYPGTESASSASHSSEKIRLLMNGLSEREAELNVVITREGGSGSPEGRRAMIELAALYISIGGSDLKPALSMLRQVAESRDEDPEAAADAVFYIGEYHYRQNDYDKAVDFFLDSAVIDPSDKDSSARALYRAADTAVLAGSRADAVRLVNRLKEFYPGSEWAVEAGKLLKEAE